MAVRDKKFLGSRTHGRGKKAGRGADGRRYPWGEAWEDGLAHTLTDTSCRAPEPIDARPADVSPFGLLGAAGNVQEWTATRRPGSDQLRAIRGGSFGEGERVAEIPVLYWVKATVVSTGIGFRLCYSPNEPPKPSTHHARAKALDQDR